MESAGVGFAAGVCLEDVCIASEVGVRLAGEGGVGVGYGSGIGAGMLPYDMICITSFSWLFGSCQISITTENGP